MFVVLLRLSHNKDQAPELLAGHKEWIQRGFDDGVFMLVGSLRPDAGGAIVAHNIALPDLQRRVSEDPFVAENVVTPEIIEIAPSRVDERLRLLLD